MDQEYRRKILEKTKDLQQSICKTKAALNKPQAHKEMNSFPACLHTTLKISVAAPEQPSTDDKVATIVHDYNAKLLDVFIEARQVELNRLVQAHNNEETPYNENDACDRTNQGFVLRR
jgi:hypothetical protein